MACEEIIGADSSPLIGLARIGQLSLLQKLAHRVIVPPAVWQEAIRGREFSPGAREISEQTWIEVSAPDPSDVQHLLSMVDAGEAEAIALAQMEGSRAVLLIDDRRARRLARELKVRHFGTIGLLSEAKRSGVIAEVKPLLEGLIANGIYISDELLKAALKRLGE